MGAHDRNVPAGARVATGLPAQDLDRALRLSSVQQPTGPLVGRGAWFHDSGGNLPRIGQPVFGGTARSAEGQPS